MKFCEKCGKELMDDAVVCMGCGCSVGKAPAAPKPSAAVEKSGGAQSSALSIVSIVVGAIGILMAWLIALLGYIFGGAALACALVAGKKVPGDKKAKTGLLLAVITLVCSVINSILGMLMMM